MSFGWVKDVRTLQYVSLILINALFIQVSISYLEIYNDSLFDLLDITTAPHEVGGTNVAVSYYRLHFLQYL